MVVWLHDPPIRAKNSIRATYVFGYSGEITHSGPEYPFGSRLASTGQSWLVEVIRVNLRVNVFGYSVICLYSGDNIILFNRVIGGICVIGGKHRISSLQVSGSIFTVGPGRTIIHLACFVRPPATTRRTFVWIFCIPASNHSRVVGHKDIFGYSGKLVYSGIRANCCIRVFGETDTFGYSGKQIYSVNRVIDLFG